MADRQLESVSQTSCLYCLQHSLWAEKRGQMCAHCALSCCSLPGSTNAGLWAWPSEPAASSPFWVAISMLFRHSSLYKNTQALATERKK